MLMRSPLARDRRSPPGFIAPCKPTLTDKVPVFRHACTMGLEGIVSKRLTSRYTSGRCRSWLKVKNPEYERRGGGG
jgi:hypothetical protein